jgi:YrbI family 3-deoxy-D-manno-octulosonate 8-phosphate phosphatase
VHLALLSGRSSPAVTARATELGIEHVLHGLEEKHQAYEHLLKRMALDSAAAGYMGDDLVDLPVLRRCGFAATTFEAPEEVRKRVHYVTASPPGRGAAREVCEFVMRAQGTLDQVLGGDGGPATQVVAEDPDALARALHAAGHSAQREGAALVVPGLQPAQVGAIAGKAQLTLLSLSPVSRSLEHAFLELIGGEAA